MADVKLKSLAISDEFTEHGSQPVLRAKYGLDAEGIVQQTLKLISHRGAAITW